jgi:hypothetical protein
MIMLECCQGVGTSGAAHNLRTERAGRLCYGGTGDGFRHGANHFRMPNRGDVDVDVVDAWLVAGHGAAKPRSEVGIRRFGVDVDVDVGSAASKTEDKG